ncbi:hypothetical protein M407DRAFT_157389 [Tulasnella calospora MUT 4182]|uniref:Uncharacterized protein n=1 Tax=Tulasnella calospora MUT 4182 TaxID=1051891 RepID=A0A0C3Q579_9AGAM|nr:hypothetical protein M407DRAFT_157389 [Tulasnella calospora MUT 4182]
MSTSPPKELRRLSPSLLPRRQAPDSSFLLLNLHPIHPRRRRQRNVCVLYNIGGTIGPPVFHCT